ncbi:MAG: hypothetical protein IPN26_00015 [Bacteroidetes bacterium]|nr:hypothetical protein [Bacteroidota bacterium]
MVGYLVIISNPYGVLQTLFYLIGVFGTIYSTRGAFLDNLMFLNPKFEVPTLFYYPILLSACFTTGTFVHFFLLFPHKSKILKYKYSTYILYLFFTIPGIWAIYRTNEMLNDPSTMGTFPHPEFLISFINIFALLLGFVSLVWSVIKYRKQEGIPLRWLAGVYLFGIGSVFALIFLPPKML